MKICRLALATAMLFFCVAHLAFAGCDLQIASAGPCLADGTAGIPHVGDIYGIKVVVNVIGTPSQPFRIKWTLANVTYYYDNINIGQGNGWWWPFLWWMDLDEPIPWSVTLDPDGVSGDTNLVNNTVSGSFTPVPPTKPVELYSPRMMHGVESYTLIYQPGSGTIPNLYILFGMPTTHGAQSIISVTSPTNGQIILTPPYGVPVIEIARTNVLASTFQDTNRFTVQLNRVRVNPTLLRTNTWASMDALTTNWTQWLAPDQRCQSTNSAITNFVQQSLPANYRTILTPYDTARTLHLAVMKKLTYQSPPAHLDAVGVLQDGAADCGGFAALLTASLRQVGIPARCISGFRQGDTVWHVRVEFHLPGVEWLVADPTDGNGNDTTGTYAYDFGDVPNADSFFAVDVGDAHIRPYFNFPFIQVPNWWWNGGATYNSYTANTYLQPNGVLSMTNSSKESIQFLLSDVPTAGSVVIQSSTNLSAWSPVVTNSASGNVLNYSFPTTDGVRRFYRANVIP
jgi:transglutaminase-like putative cysteine protease